MKKVQCPICGNISSEKQCQNCGWDFTKDILNYPAAAKAEEGQRKAFADDLFYRRAAYGVKALEKRSQSENPKLPAPDMSHEQKDVPETKRSNPESADHPAAETEKTEKAPDREQTHRLRTVILVIIGLVSLSQWVSLLENVWNYGNKILQNSVDMTHSRVILSLLLDMPELLLILFLLPPLIFFGLLRLRHGGYRVRTVLIFAVSVCVWAMFYVIIFDSFGESGDALGTMGWAEQTLSPVFWESPLYLDHGGIVLVLIGFFIWHFILFSLPVILFLWMMKKTGVQKLTVQTVIVKAWLAAAAPIGIGWLCLLTSTRSFQTLSMFAYTWISMAVPLAVQMILYILCPKTGGGRYLWLYAGQAVALILWPLQWREVMFVKFGGFVYAAPAAVAAYILLRKWLEKSCGDDEKEAKRCMGIASLIILTGVPSMMIVLSFFGKLNEVLFEQQLWMGWLLLLVYGISAVSARLLMKLRFMKENPAAAYVLTAAAASFELLVLLGLSDGETLLLSVWSFDTAAGYLFCAFSGIAVSTVAVTVLGQPKKDTFKTNKSGGGV